MIACCAKKRECKAVGCTVDLLALHKPYCLRKKLCPDHIKADAIAIKGAGPGLFRYCQQCGKVEPLSRFQAGKRSCRAALIKRRTCSKHTEQQQQPSCTAGQPAVLAEAAAAAAAAADADAGNAFDDVWVAVKALPEPSAAQLMQMQCTVVGEGLYKADSSSNSGTHLLSPDCASSSSSKGQASAGSSIDCSYLAAAAAAPLPVSPAAAVMAGAAEDELDLEVLLEQWIEQELTAAGAEAKMGGPNATRAAGTGEAAAPVDDGSPFCQPDAAAAAPVCASNPAASFAQLSWQQQQAAAAHYEAAAAALGDELVHSILDAAVPANSTHASYSFNSSAAVPEQALPLTAVAQHAAAAPAPALLAQRLAELYAEFENVSQELQCLQQQQQQVGYGFAAPAAAPGPHSFAGNSTMAGSAVTTAAALAQGPVGSYQHALLPQHLTGPAGLPSSTVVAHAYGAYPLLEAAAGLLHVPQPLLLADDAAWLHVQGSSSSSPSANNRAV